MSPIKNARVIFNDYPEGYPEPGKSLVVDESETIDLDNEALNGGILVKLLVLSIEPLILGFMNKTRPPSLPFGCDIGKPIFGFSVSKVLRSENSRFSAGDHILGLHPFTEYAILNNLDNFGKLKNPLGLPWSTYLGICGLPGKTAHHGYKEYIQPFIKKGDTIYITTGAGAVGSLLIQLAKLDGLKVIASASSEEKVKFMKECGADVAFNYKTTSVKDVLAEHGPINFYWDHVGGETLDCALEASAPLAHFVICGMISILGGASQPIKNFGHVLFKGLTVNGYLVSNFNAMYDAAFADFIHPMVAKGQLKYKEYTRHGIVAVDQTLIDVVTGKNEGKGVVVLADE